MSATMMVADSRRDIDPAVWTPGHAAVIRAAAAEPEVERIFVNAAIKKALCRDDEGRRDWLNKVRPMWGHDYHFHVRIGCPDDSPDCKPQDPVPERRRLRHRTRLVVPRIDPVSEAAAEAAEAEAADDAGRAAAGLPQRGVRALNAVAWARGSRSQNSRQRKHRRATRRRCSPRTMRRRRPPPHS